MALQVSSSLRAAGRARGCCRKSSGPWASSPSPQAPACPPPGARPTAPDALAEQAGAACRPLPGAQRQPRKQRRRRERPGRCAHGVARVSEALRLRRGRLLGEGRAEPCVSATWRPLCLSLGQTPVTLSRQVPVRDPRPPPPTLGGRGRARVSPRGRGWDQPGQPLVGVWEPERWSLDPRRGEAEGGDSGS